MNGFSKSANVLGDLTTKIAISVKKRMERWSREAGRQALCTSWPKICEVKMSIFFQIRTTENFAVVKSGCCQPGFSFN